MRPKTEAGWRTSNAGRVLSLATAMFERDAISVVQDTEFAWVSHMHLALFRNLDLEGGRLTDLAARASMTKQSMQELVDKAEAWGVVERRPAADDRRAKIVIFTPAGLRMLDLLRHGVAEAERRLAAAMDAEFLDDMKARLTAYAAARDEAAPRQALRQAVSAS